jgi:predicted phosphoadenosine phosphosulfate sulfurtransferase
MGRHYGLFSAGGHITKPKASGVRSVWPVYDWKDSDVWRAIAEQKWDYNRAYDVLYKLGLKHSRLRIAPIALNSAAAEALPYAARAWPRWFDKVCDRLPGIRQAAQFGIRVAQPFRRQGESWEECFKRECIERAPAEWIRERAEATMRAMLQAHSVHSVDVPFPERVPCYNCHGNLGSWKNLASAMYNGDPFAMKSPCLTYMEPEFFRPGAGKWGGAPSF